MKSLATIATLTQASSKGFTQGKNDAALRDACRQFEAVFTAQLLKEMRRGVPENGALPRSSGQQLFEEMLDGEYAQQMSRTQGMGMAELMYRQFQRTPAAETTEKLDKFSATR